MVGALGTYADGSEQSGSFELFGRRIGLPRQDVAVITVAGLSTIGRGPFLFALTGRVALLLLVGVPGLLVLVRRVLHRDRSAQLLALFVAAALCSALFSPGIVQSLKGGLVSSNSVLVYALVAGWWAIGASLSDKARGVLPWVLLGGFGLNALIGLLQILLPIEHGTLRTFPGRASGLFVNPVYYGSFGAGITCWMIAVAVCRSDRRTLVLSGCVAFAAGLSGSRVAVLAIAITALAAVVMARPRRRGMAVGVAVAIGTVASSVLSAVLPLFSDRYVSGRSTVERFSTGETAGARAEIWRYGLDAFVDRPLFGWGLGHFGTATWSRYTLAFVESSRWDDQVQPWTDPHNIVVLLLTSVGAVGVVLAGWFVVTTLRSVGDVRLVAFVAGVAMTWLLQPAFIETLPLAMLVFGAAVGVPIVGSVDGDLRANAGRFRSLLASTVIIGLLAAVYVGVADYRLRSAARARDLGALEDAANWFFRDAGVTDYVAGRYESAYAQGDDTATDSVRWSLKTVELLPNRPMAHNELAFHQYLAGDLVGMKASIDRSLQLQEWNPTAHKLLVVYATAADDSDLLESARGEACAMGLSICNGIEANG